MMTIIEKKEDWFRNRRMILKLASSEVVEGLELGPTAKLMGAYYNPTQDSLDLIFHGIGRYTPLLTEPLMITYQELSSRKDHYIPKIENLKE